MQGKKLVFVTNNSRKSRRQYSKKFRSLGLEVTEVVFDLSRLPVIFFCIVIICYFVVGRDFYIIVCGCHVLEVK